METHNFSSSDIKEIASEIATQLSMYQKEVLSLAEAAKYLGIARSYLYKLTMNRVLPHFKPNGKMCYFKKSDLDAWLQKNRVATDDEIQSQANDYLNKKGGRR